MLLGQCEHTKGIIIFLHIINKQNRNCNHSVFQLNDTEFVIRAQIMVLLSGVQSLSVSCFHHTIEIL